MSEILKPTPEQLVLILADHAKYLRGESDGKRADLRSADLRSANLYGADLKDLLNGALVLARTEILPREGEVVGWKKCYSGVIVKLKVPADAKRSNAPGGRKCRAERAEVLEVFGRDGSPVEVGISLYHSAVQYRKGATVAAHEWGTDRLIECAGGIHFYLTRDEAEVHV